MISTFIASFPYHSFDTRGTNYYNLLLQPSHVFILYDIFELSTRHSGYQGQIPLVQVCRTVMGWPRVMALRRNSTVLSLR